MTSTSYPNSRYLSSKKSVDDRALNQHVVTALREAVGAVPLPLRVIEVGAGLGTMIARLVDWRILSKAEYTLLDVDHQSLKDARSWLSAWADSSGRRIEHSTDTFRLRGGSPEVDILVRPVCAELRSYLERNEGGPKAQLLIAHAFLDLVDVPAIMPALLQLLAPTGLYWFSANFDGETVFCPAHALDDTLLEVYHRSMDERVRYGRRAGDRRCGRHLFGNLAAVKAKILASGSSDWVVHATDGEYVADEGYFVDHILHTIDMELNARADVDQAALGAWLRTRRSQLARGELVYIAHQLDFFGLASG